MLVGEPFIFRGVCVASSYVLALQMFELRMNVVAVAWNEEKEFFRCFADPQPNFYFNFILSLFVRVSSIYNKIINSYKLSLTHYYLFYLSKTL